MTKQVHLTLQGKGGVGKSLVASLVAQHLLRTHGGDVACVDTDPVNATFAGYKAFSARRLELLKDGIIDAGRFDELMTWVVSEDVHFTIDNGASCFVPMATYLSESKALEVVASTGRQVVLHSVITGGYGLRDTLNGLDVIAAHMPPETKIVVWLNEFFGPISGPDGRSFKDTQVYQRHQARIAGLMRLPKQNEQTTGRDLQAMLDRRLTFAEALASPDFNLFAKQRIAMLERQLMDQLKTLD